MSGHTPGPWKIRRHERGQVEIVTGDAVSNVALVHGLSLRPDGDPETDANAALIASAPDLLEALRGLLAIYDRYTGVGLREIDAARAAIAKADGVRP